MLRYIVKTINNILLICYYTFSIITFGSTILFTGTERVKSCRLVIDVYFRAYFMASISRFKII